jgi:hypothetical protein
MVDERIGSQSFAQRRMLLRFEVFEQPAIAGDTPYLAVGGAGDELLV